MNFSSDSHFFLFTKLFKKKPIWAVGPPKEYSPRIKNSKNILDTEIFFSYLFFS